MDIGSRDNTIGHGIIQTFVTHTPDNIGLNDLVVIMIGTIELDLPTNKLQDE